MRRVDLDLVKTLMAYGTKAVSSDLFKKVVDELEAARRVVGSAVVSKDYLLRDGYTDLAREAERYAHEFFFEDT